VVGLDEVVVPVDRGAQAGVAGGDLFVQQVWDEPLPLAEQELEPGL
jgi:hypothetical protein